MRINFTPQFRVLLSVCALSLVVLLGACSGTGQPDAPALETQIADSVAATLTAMPTVAPSRTATEPPASATPEPTIVPTVRPTRPVPTAAPPVSTTFPKSSYVLEQEQVIGEYAIRIWRNERSPDDGVGFDSILTLAQAGEPPIQIEYFSGLDPLSGTDLTADGVPELIVNTYTGGAHCCFGVTVVSLGDVAAKIMETRPSNCGGQFSDLDGDGVLEFVTCDDIFAYAYCSFAASPIVTAVLAYTPEAGYAPASPQFPEQYAAGLPAQRAQAESATPGGLGEWDTTTKCAVLPYVLALLYSGQPDQAWSELARLYTFPDADAFRQEIEQTAGTSQLFTLP